MPKNWKTYKLDDICTNITDGAHSSPKELVNGSKLIATVKDMTDFGFNLEQCKRISEEDFQKLDSSGCIPNKGDVLFSKDGTIGKVLHYKSDNKIGLLSSIAIFRPNNEYVDSSFLAHYLSDKSINNYIRENFRSGSAIPRIILRDFKKFELTIPPLPEQKAIANILSTIDDKIENNLAINKTLEDMAMALYKHWFVDFGPFQDGEFIDSELGPIPEGWEVKRLDEICKFSNGYAFKSKELLKIQDRDSYHVFKMGNIERGGGLKSNASKSFIKKKLCNHLQKYILKKGDLLMAMTDMKDKVAILGNTALVDVDDKYIVNQRVGLMRISNNKEVDFPFMFLATNEHNFLENLRNQANSGVQVNLSTNAIKSAKLLVGDIQTNKNFNNLVKDFYEKIFQISQENQSLSRLRDTLLAKLISGEVRLKEFQDQVAQII